MHFNLLVNSLNLFDTYLEEQLIDYLAILGVVLVKQLLVVVFFDFVDDSTIVKSKAHLGEKVTDEKLVEISIIAIVQIQAVLDKLVESLPAVWERVGEVCAEELSDFEGRHYRFKI